MAGFNHIEITRSRSKKKPIKVRKIAENNEVLSHHLLGTRRAAIKNILAEMQLYNGDKVEVVDKLKKGEKKRFVLHKSGLEQYYL